MPILYRNVVPNIASWTAGNDMPIFYGSSLVRRTPMRMRVKSLEVTVHASGLLVSEYGWPSTLVGTGGVGIWHDWVYGAPPLGFWGAVGLDLERLSVGIGNSLARPNHEDDGIYYPEAVFPPDISPNFGPEDSALEFFANIEADVGFEWTSDIQEVNWIARVNEARCLARRWAWGYTSGSGAIRQRVYSESVFSSGLPYSNAIRVVGDVKFPPKLRVGNCCRFEFSLEASPCGSVDFAFEIENEVAP